MILEVIGGRSSDYEGIGKFLGCGNCFLIWVMCWLCDKLKYALLRFIFFYGYIAL